MTKKRRNNGKNRKGRGHVGFVRCNVSGRAVPKDKAVARWSTPCIVDNSSSRDVMEALAYSEGTDVVFPRIYNKMYYSISAAVHQKVVRARPKNERKIRENPRRRNQRQNKPRK